MTDIEELKKLAEAAGGNEWTLRVHTSEVENFDPKFDDWTITNMGKEVVAWEQDGIQKQEFVRFIAAANPQTVLALIRELEEARKLNMRALDYFEARLAKIGGHVDVGNPRDDLIIDLRAARQQQG